MTDKEFNLILNDILSQVKPIYLRKGIMLRLYNIFTNKNKEIADLKKELSNCRKIKDV